jgi:pSer/pThr/pTyr-binding forkhead associated (FHA) protein
LAVLQNCSTSSFVTLGADTTVGRGAENALVLDGRTASRNHAAIRFEAGQWTIRDLNSANGTWVGGTPIGLDEVVVKKGALVRFGVSGDWLLVDDGPPEPCARERETGERIRGEDGVLLLQEEGDRVATVVPDDTTGWQLTQNGIGRSVVDQEEIEIGSTPFVLELPPGGPARITPRTSRDGCVLAQTSVVFHVSRDEEDVAITVASPQWKKKIPHRAANYLLLQLARLRIEEAGRGLSPGEAGWMFVEDVCNALKLDVTHVNVNVFRARKAFADLGVADAADLVQRRGGQRSLRIGVADLTIVHG